MGQAMSVTLFVEVNDQEEVRKAAHERAKQDGVEGEDLANYLKAEEDGGQSLGNCLRMLFDPGVSPPGLSILDSSAE